MQLDGYIEQISAAIYKLEQPPPWKPTLLSMAVLLYPEPVLRVESSLNWDEESMITGTLTLFSESLLLHATLRGAHPLSRSRMLQPSGPDRSHLNVQLLRRGDLQAMRMIHDEADGFVNSYQAFQVHEDEQPETFPPLVRVSLTYRDGPTITLPGDPERCRLSWELLDLLRADLMA